jgi:hypothetical protein
VKKAFNEAHDAAGSRVCDKVKFNGAASNALSAEVVTEEARNILHRELLGHPAVPEWMRLGIALGSGCAAAADAFAASLLFEAVERLHQRQPFDATMVESAVLTASRAGVRATLTTYIKVSDFLARARPAFNARILAKVGRGVVWAEAIADIVVSTAVEVWRWIKREIEFGELLRRAGVHISTATGGALVAFGALALMTGAPAWLQIAAVLVAGWAGAKVGRAIGENLFSPNWTQSLAPSPQSAEL